MHPTSRAESDQSDRQRSDTVWNALFCFLQKAEPGQILQLQTDCFHIRQPLIREHVRIFVPEQIFNLWLLDYLSVSKKIHQTKVQKGVICSEAFCFKCPVKRIVKNAASVNRQKYLFSGTVLIEPQIFLHPAFDPPALIIIAAGTDLIQRSIFLTGIE